MPSEFVNEPLEDFSNPEIAAKMESALERVRAELGVEYPLLIDGEKVTTDAKITSIDPSNPDSPTALTPRTCNRCSSA